MLLLAPISQPLGIHVTKPNLEKNHMPLKRDNRKITDTGNRSCLKIKFQLIAQKIFKRDKPVLKWNAHQRLELATKHNELQTRVKKNLKEYQLKFVSRRTNTSGRVCLMSNLPLAKMPNLWCVIQPPIYRATSSGPLQQVWLHRPTRCHRHNQPQNHGAFVTCTDSAYQHPSNISSKFTLHMLFEILRKI